MVTLKVLKSKKILMHLLQIWKFCLIVILTICLKMI